MIQTQRDANMAQPLPTQMSTTDINLLETSTNSSDSHSQHIVQALARTPSSEKRSKRSRKSNSGKEYHPSNITYRGMNIFTAAEQGNMPVCVLLWSLASSKRVNLIATDSNGNNPMHYGAVADTPEVVQFLLQQTRNSEEFKLVESRNFAGETPLLRCMSTGNIPVAKVLIDEGSDPLVTDNHGGSIFTHLARAGHLWCLHFMFNTITNLHGPQVTLELMSSIDVEGKSPLDWAAEYGHVNILEFFIRRGLHPHKLDIFGRQCLSWAVRANQVAACTFLVLGGCDPFLVDAQHMSPMWIALAMKDKELIVALKKAHKESIRNNSTCCGGNYLLSSVASCLSCCLCFCPCITSPSYNHLASGAISSPSTTASSNAATLSGNAPATDVTFDSVDPFGRPSKSDPFFQQQAQHQQQQQYNNININANISSNIINNTSNNNMNHISIQKNSNFATLLYRRVGNRSWWNCLPCVNSSSSNSSHNTVAKFKSIAIYRKNPQHMKYIFIYMAFFTFLWLIPAFVPFYVVIAVYFLIYFVHRKVEKYYADHPGIKSPIKRVIQCKEKGIGFWGACMLLYAVYLVASLFAMNDSSENMDTFEYLSIKYPHSYFAVFLDVKPKNPLHILGLSGGENAPWFLYAAFLIYFTAIFTGLKLIFWDWNPGIIDNRIQDFEEILAHSFISAGEPSHGLYCRTSMVKKPIRGKYCVHTGAVVARMDHYCTWLNTTIGYNNHRSFMAFLFVHFATAVSGCVLVVRSLVNEFAGNDFSVCTVLERLVSRWYFLVVILLGLLLLASILLAMLVYDQGLNIATNWTTNERINLTRYPWIMQQSDGSYTTRFDRGVFTNILEFLCVPGFNIDYASLFILPVELTQENMHTFSNTDSPPPSSVVGGSSSNHLGFRQSNRLNSIRVNNIHRTYTGPLHSGPPSVDLEMVGNSPPIDNNNRSMPVSPTMNNSYNYNVHHNNHNNNNNISYNHINIASVAGGGSMKPRGDSFDSSDTSNAGTDS